MSIFWWPHYLAGKRTFHLASKRMSISRQARHRPLALLRSTACCIVHLHSVISLEYHPRSCSSALFPFPNVSISLYVLIVNGGVARGSETQSQIPAGSIWLVLRSTCMPNLKRRVAIFCCFEDHKWRCRTQKACFRGRARDSEAQSQIAAGSPWQIFDGPARRI